MALVRWEPLSMRPWFHSSLFNDNADWSYDANDGMNVYETEDTLVIEANMPGIPEDKISVSLENGVVTLRGEVENTEVDEKRKYYKKMESRAYHYTTPLPRSVEAERATAEVKNGTVTVTFPKAEIEKPKRIEIKKSN